MTETKSCLHCGATMYKRYFDGRQKWAARRACSRECGYKIRTKIANEQSEAQAIRDAAALASYMKHMRASAKAQRRRRELVKMGAYL